MRTCNQIFVIWDDVVLRATIAGSRKRPEVSELLSHDRRPGGTIEEAIEQLGPGGGGSALVLSEEVFIQTIAIPGAALRGLNAEQLESTLAFEARLASGFAREEARLAWQKSEDGRRFQVAQLANEDFSAIENGMDACGLQLAGVLHPAGLPRALATTGGAAFVRDEYWGDLRVRVQGQNGKPARVILSRSGDQAEAAGEPTERLARRRLDFGREMQTLEDDGSLRRWLAGWAAAWNESAGELLAVRPRRPERKGLARAAAFLAAIAIATGLSFLDHRHLNQDLVEARDAMTALRAPQLERDRLASSVRSLEQRLKSSAAAPATGEEVQPRPSANGVVTAILQSLTERRPRGLVVDSFELALDGCQLHGRANSLLAIDALSEGMGKDLARIGQVVLPSERNRSVVESAILRFSIDVAPRDGARRRSTIERDLDALWENPR